MRLRTSMPNITEKELICLKHSKIMKKKIHSIGILCDKFSVKKSYRNFLTNVNMMLTTRNGRFHCSLLKINRFNYLGCQMVSRI